MLIAIIQKRQKMSNKDSLLEQAAISAAGLQQSHILGIFALLILIITIFGLLGLKKITWALLLMLNIVLFAYLMKLTVDGSVKETIIGPDGKIADGDASDEEEEDDDNDDEDPASPKKKKPTAGYENPELPPITWSSQWMESHCLFGKWSEEGRKRESRPHQQYVTIV